MFSSIDYLLNRVTMYRCMLYFLIFLVSALAVLGFLNLSPYKPADILLSLVVSITVIYLTNKVFAKAFNAQTNTESFLITALILILITPIKFPQNLALVLFVSFVSMASKYILAYKKRHIFNPAAVSLVVAFFVLGEKASWWISSSYLMLPLVILGGLLILRKIQREGMLASFFISYFLIISSLAFVRTGSFETVLQIFKTSILDSSLFFFAFVMLVEPRTSPQDKKIRIFYGTLVGLLYAVSQLGLLGSILTAELSLVLGNVFSFFANPNYRLLLTLKGKKKITQNTYEFIFTKQPGFNFAAGQYMEWTLPHKMVDSRGNRRYFSISSSPTEENIAITSKFYEPSSTFKQALLNLEEGEKIIAAELAGSFTLPKDISSPLAFIAGGIGITPFRSMISYIVDNNLRANIILLYSNKTEKDIVFSGLLKKAEKNGVKTIFFNTQKAGRIDEETIKKQIKDFKERTFYLSGPQSLVKSFEKILANLRVPKSKIKTDFFPGYEE